jgi:hypothetical protein
MNPPAFAEKTRRYTGKRADGMRCERKVKEWAGERYGDMFVPGPWFRYKELGKAQVRFCQPDGLLFAWDMRRIYLLEMKLKHTSDAWWQLKHLYLPVVAKCFPPSLWEYSLCEVVKWFDPAIAMPEKTRMVPDILIADPGDFAVHIYRP